MMDHRAATCALLDILALSKSPRLYGLMACSDGALAVAPRLDWGVPDPTPIHAEDLGLALQCLCDAGECWPTLYLLRKVGNKVDSVDIGYESMSVPDDVAAHFLAAARWSPDGWSFESMAVQMEAVAAGTRWGSTRVLKHRIGWSIHATIDGEVSVSVNMSPAGRLQALVCCEDCDDEFDATVCPSQIVIPSHDTGLLTARNVAEVVAWFRNHATPAALAHLASDGHRAWCRGDR